MPGTPAKEAMTLAQRLLPELEQQLANTLKVLNEVPDGRNDFAPHEKSMPLTRLAGLRNALHVVGCNSSKVRIWKNYAWGILWQLIKHVTAGAWRS